MSKLKYGCKDINEKGVIGQNVLMKTALQLDK